jgi:hypothetical protein
MDIEDLKAAIAVGRSIWVKVKNHKHPAMTRVMNWLYGS